jgi:hypothetical protein
MPSANRFFPALFDHLSSVHWWDSTSRLGLVYYDVPAAVRVVSSVVKPALQRSRLHVVAEAAMEASTQNAAAIGQIESQMQSAMVKFRSQGVTHVVFVGQGLEYMWTVAQKSQGYTAKYTLTSADQAQNLSAADTPGAEGLGWIPTYDISAEGPTPGRGRCDRIARAIGASGAVAMGLLQTECDLLYFLKDSYDRTGAVTPAALHSGASAFLGALPSMTAFPGGRGDGPSIGYDLSAGGKCGCYHYGAKSTF